MAHSFSPLFLTGTARSGSTLLAKMMSAHPDIMVASDPYFWYFKAYRNAAMKHCAKANDLFFDPNSPFHDYYFSPDQLLIMDALQQAPLDVPVDKEEWDGLYERRKIRMAYECPDLVELLPSMQGNDFKQLLNAGLGIIARGRDARHRRWIGLKEVWIIEFYKALAEAYPDAKFVVIVRDPRGVVASHLKMVERHPDQDAHTPSYIRHWRKYLAFIAEYQTMSLFKERLFVVRYENLVNDPAHWCRELCNFLDIPHNEAMLDYASYRDYRSGGQWKGNASSEKQTLAITNNFNERWRQSLGQDLVKFTEYLCYHDMASIELTPSVDDDLESRRNVFRYFQFFNDGDYSWRSDSQDVSREAGHELVRFALTGMDDVVSLQDIRKNFFSLGYYNKIMKGGDNGYRLHIQRVCFIQKYL